MIFVNWMYVFLFCVKRDGEEFIGLVFEVFCYMVFYGCGICYENKIIKIIY